MAGASRILVRNVAPTLSGAGIRAKDAMTSILELIKRRRADALDARQSMPARRMTAPPPGGALTNDGRRLVREDGIHDDDGEDAFPRRNYRRAAILGGAVGLVAVLAVFGAAHGVSTGAKHPASPEGATAALAAGVADTAPTAPRGVSSGAPIVNVPLFGPTPASTLEPAAPPPVASAAPGGAPAPGDSDPLDKLNGPILKEWGAGDVRRPVMLRVRTDGPISRLTGASGDSGFTIVLPDRRSLSSETDLLRKDKRLASVKVVNGSRGSEITLQFRDSVPAYLAKIKGDKLEIALGREPRAGKVAKKRKKQ
jgi:hypothetical protein